ncbi:ABC transporter permease [Kitasatospora sp. GP82]|uniref:ABC transporter permease n=1 Tax=Kitasatospora sp. GP82 TaxID=3035089 RepID=UPI0024766D88|nr:ABC transporter permease [Kitasatospora sp. GP82]MDH6123100.1 putative ABC transport system permease protein [Kitasatospora sp. GP82]
MYRTALRNVLAHKGRLLMTALAILLGTAFVAGTLVFSDTLGQAMKNSYAKSYSDVSVLVTDNSTGMRIGPKGTEGKQSAKLTDATVRQIAALPGAQDARGVISGFIGVSDKKGNLIGQIWSATGSNYVPGSSGKDARYPLAEGRAPSGAKEIALDKSTAQKAGYHVGDTVRIATNGPAMDVRLAGIVTTDDPQITSGGTLALMDTASAQKLLLTPGQYSSISVQAKPGTAEAALLGEVGKVLPKGDNFRTETGQQLKDDQTRAIATGTNGMKTVLLVFAAISLFVGIFIIANTFTMLVAQRTKELALLRAVGASRRQVTRSVLVEALAIGVIASVAGLLAGIGIGAGMQSLVASMNDGMPTGSLVVAPTTIVVSLVVGVLVTVLSAVIPAVRASRIAPVAAMSSGDQPATQKSLVVRNVIGALITAGGLGLILMGAATKSDAGRMPVGAGVALAMIGIFVLLPLLSRPVIALVGPVLAKLAGTPGKLARQNAVRNPRRTAATAAALTIGLTLVSGLTVLGASVTDVVDRAVTSSMKADYDVAMATGGLTPELATAIGKAPGVTASSPVNKAYWEFGGTSHSVYGIDAAGFEQLVQPKMLSGSASALKQGQILVDGDMAKKENLSVGSTLKVDYRSGSEGTVTVGGVYEGNAMLSEVVMANAEVAKHETDPYLSDVLVKGADGPTAALKQSIKDATGNNPVVEVKTKQDMRDEFNRVITFVLNMMYGLLAMSVLVAVLGVINTLAMSVFERKREIGMLRAIGLDRSGIKRMVRLESVVISLFGAVIGVLLGCFTAWAVNRTLVSSLAGLTTVVPYGKMLLFLALAGLVGLVAALWPARKASKLDILASIKTD